MCNRLIKLCNMDRIAYCFLCSELSYMPVRALKLDLFSVRADVHVQQKSIISTFSKYYAVWTSRKKFQFISITFPGRKMWHKEKSFILDRYWLTIFAFTAYSSHNNLLLVLQQMIFDPIKVNFVINECAYILHNRRHAVRMPHIYPSRFCKRIPNRT
jgi:hypothetical protein